MMGGYRTNNPTLGAEKEDIPEGDYLRRKVEIEDDDDDETSGCLSLFWPKSSSRDSDIVPRQRRMSTDSIPPPQPNRFAEKVLCLLRPTYSDQLLTSKQKPSHSAANVRGGQGHAPRRKYMRVVTDRHAPPPDRPNDNPNIISHYSQSYLQSYYANRRPDGGLPYVVSDTSILKKSSTDPTCNQRMMMHAELSSTTVMGECGKHATFNHVVTVFDSAQQTVTEERLHGDGDDELDATSPTSGDDEQVGTFFLDSADSTVAREADVAVENVVVVGDDDVVAERCSSLACIGAKDEAMQNFFSTFSVPPPVAASGQALSKSARQVDLKSVMEQSRASEG